MGLYPLALKSKGQTSMTGVELPALTTKAIARTVPRLFRARRELKGHNRDALRAYEDLTSWVTDDDHELTIELRRIDNELNSRNLFHSGERGSQRREAKRRRLQRYRDRERHLERHMQDMELCEGWQHQLWRSRVMPTRFRLTWPLYARESDVEATLTRWREPEEGGDGPVAITEPT